jgi:hypothetical protein
MASEARNASVAVGVFADRARELEAAAQAAELHAVSLSEAQGRAVLDLVERAFGIVDLPIPREALRGLLRGDEISEDVAAVARAEVRRLIASEVRREMQAELDAQQRALPAPESESEADGEVVDGEVLDIDVPEPVVDQLPSWESLPDDWKRRFGLHRHLGRVELARELELDRRQRERRRAGGSRRESHSPSFRHPALGGS